MWKNNHCLKQSEKWSGGKVMLGPPLAKKALSQMYSLVNWVSHSTTVEKKRCNQYCCLFFSSIKSGASVTGSTEEPCPSVHLDVLTCTTSQPGPVGDFSTSLQLLQGLGRSQRLPADPALQTGHDAKLHIFRQLSWQAGSRQSGQAQGTSQ